MIFGIQKTRIVIPRDYMPKLDFFQTQKGILLIKEIFEKEMKERLSLQKIQAPIFLKTGTGLQDDLAGTQIPVSFKVKFMAPEIEVVQALTKWKRHVIGKYDFKIGTGIITDMKAIRKDEEIDETHSLFVDQWDWELAISKEQRTLEFLKSVVRKIYGAMLEAEKIVEKEFPKLEPRLPEDIEFVHAEDLEDMYPDLSPKEREDKIARKHGAVFLIGIGSPLKSGMPHDLRAADYDDWSTQTIERRRGLNGDIIVWDSISLKSLELTSMGIRVDAESLIAQLKLTGLLERKELPYHRGIIESKLPLTIGGGFGQSRLYMFLLHKTHIGEVQPSIWSEKMEKKAMKRGIKLLQ